MGRPVFIIDEAAISGFPGTDRGRVAREVARLLAAAGVQVLVTIDGPISDAHPGRIVEADTSHGGGDEWVI